MTSELSPPSHGRDSHGLLRAVALAALLAGSVGSVALMFHAGRHNPSHLLLFLFTLWVLSPFMALILAMLLSQRWSAITRIALDCVTLLLALGSLATYAYIALGPPRAKIAVAFVVVPPASWVLIGITLSIATLISNRSSRRAGRETK
jgi:hypothetical protein